MNGSSPPRTLPPPLTVPLTASHDRLRRYNQQRLLWPYTINVTLSKLHSFQQQRRAQVSAEWLQRAFGEFEARRQLAELADYYRYYRNTPVLAPPKYHDLMNHYWQKTKTLYYRRIKRQLQLTDGSSQGSAEPHIQQSDDKISYMRTTFELPEHLKNSRHSLLLSFHQDPDATLRKLIDALNHKMQLKQQTREGSKIADENLAKPHQHIAKTYTYQHTAKSQTKTHLRTNPSHLVSTSSFKKTKKKIQHKSLSNEPQKVSPHVYKEKKLNTMGSFQKLAIKHNELNYQRRNKPQKGEKNLKNHHVHNLNHMHKQTHAKEIHPQRQSANHAKTKEGSVKKAKSKERSQKKNSVKRVSVSKFRQVEGNTNVKAAIDRAKGKIKAEKNIAMKKYIQANQSCNKSNDSRHPDFKLSKK